MPDATGKPIPAEIAYEGEWRIEPTESHGAVNFGLRYAPSSSNRSGSMALADLGLTADKLAGDRHEIRFELRREAGTFVCQGTVEAGRGGGTFRFRPDPAYSSAIADTGIMTFDLRDHIKAAMFDVSSSFVNIVVGSFPRATFSQLLALRIFRIAPDVVAALHTEFPDGGVDDLVALGMFGVTPDYVNALRRAEIGDLTAHNVAALRASGVDQAFVDGLAANVHRPRSIDEIVELYRRAS
jgi:hypothetical protein